MTESTKGTAWTSVGPASGMKGLSGPSTWQRRNGPAGCFDTDCAFVIVDDFTNILQKLFARREFRLRQLSVVFHFNCLTSNQVSCDNGEILTSESCG